MPDRSQELGGRPLPGYVLLSFGFWQTHYAGDPAVVGQTLDLNSTPNEIVGVMPPGFFFPEPGVQIWKAFGVPAGSASRTFPTYPAVARLRPEVSLETAQAEIDVLSASLDEEFPNERPVPVGFQIGNEDVSNERFARTVGLFQIRDLAVRNYRTVLWLLLGAVSLVLLIACANLANLLLARGASRAKDLAIRASLGAGRVVLMRQLVIESMGVSFLAGVCGVGLAELGLRLVLGLGVVEIPRLEGAAINLSVLVFAAGASLTTGVIAGLVPAWKASRIDLIESLKQGGERSTTSGTRRLGDTLVVAEVALALLLLIGAGLLVRSAVNLGRIDWGFRPAGSAALAIRSVRFGQETPAVVEQLRSIPGIVSAGAGTMAPLVPSAVRLGERIVADGSPVSSGVAATRIVVTPGYLEALGVTVRGRAFGERDTRGVEKVVILDASLALALFGQDDPIGRLVHLATLKNPDPDGGVDLDALGVGGSADPNDFEVTGRTAHTVVGIADDMKMTSDLLADAGQPLFYVDSRQWEEHLTSGETAYLEGYSAGAETMSPLSLGAFVIRTGGDPESAIEAARAAIATAHPDVSFQESASMQTLVSRAIGGAGEKQLVLVLSVVFGALSLVLAGAGIYGVISHGVSQRIYEIGVRTAMGAKPSNILGMVLRQGLLLTGIGLTLGLAASLAASRVLESQLFGVTPTDPITFLVVTLFLLAVAAVASLIPARRAARVDPLVATRAE